MTDDWKLFTNENREEPKEIDWDRDLPAAPSWRRFDQQVEKRKRRFVAPPQAVEIVNASLYLRRPLLITGNPGTGKSSLAYAVAHELGLGEVLKWPITTRSTLQDGLYRYDAIARLRESQRSKTEDDGLSLAQKGKEKEAPENIGKFIRLGPLGTALIPRKGKHRKKPRILLIDEIDKSDIDLPNNLLNVFEDGEFDIPELVRIKEQTRQGVTVDTYYRHADEELTYTVPQGQVKADTFPFVIMTSNGEREFPPAFLRRCLRLDIPDPDETNLRKIVKQHLGDESAELNESIQKLLTDFLHYRDMEDRSLATDQLLNAIYLLTQHRTPSTAEREILLERLFQSLDR